MWLWQLYIYYIKFYVNNSDVRTFFEARQSARLRQKTHLNVNNNKLRNPQQYIRILSLITEKNYFDSSLIIYKRSITNPKTRPFWVLAIYIQYQVIKTCTTYAEKEKESSIRIRNQYYPKWRANAMTAVLSFHKSEIGIPFPFRSNTFTVSNKSAVSSLLTEDSIPVHTRKPNMIPRFIIDCDKSKRIKTNKKNS